jgi:serine/threonine protein kinase
MWSTGIIATALLTGDVIFTNREDPDYKQDPSKVILAMAAECDLSVLDNPYSVWANIHKRPKDFVRKLLVLDEEQRMTVDQALAHEWFTHKFVVNEFDALYLRAIAEWEPRRKVFRLIEALDHSRLHFKEMTLRSEKHKADPSMSQYFVRPSVPDLPAGTAMNSNFHSKRAHTPLPKITEEAEMDDLNLPYSKIQNPGIEHGFDVQHSLSQLAISVHSSASEASTDILITDHGVPNSNSLEYCANLDFSTSPVVPPPGSSSPGNSSLDLIPDTPPLVRKRKSSSPSRDLSDFADNEPGFDGVENVQCSTTAKKARVS